MYKHGIIAVLLLFVGFASSKTFSGSDGEGCSYYYYAYEGGLTQNDAQQGCVAWGGTLAIPDTAATMEYLRTLWNQPGNKPNEGGNLHVGGVKTNGKFYWSTGVEVGSNGYSGWPPGGGETQGQYMGIRHQDGGIFWRSVDNAGFYVCQKIDTSLNPTVTCNSNRWEFRRTHEQCHGFCVCQTQYYGSNCEFTKPVIENCNIHPTSNDPVFPLNITCNITGYPINDQTTVQWKVDGKILANYLGDAVFYRGDVLNSVGVGIASVLTLVIKKAICLGNLKIELVVKQSFEASSNTKELFINSKFNTVANVKTESPTCNGSMINVQWSSNVPNHLQTGVQYAITTTPKTQTFATTQQLHTLTGFNSLTSYEVKIESSSNRACLGGYTQQFLENITTGFTIPTPVHSYKVRTLGDLTCELSWSHNRWNNVESYKIFITGDTIHARSNVTFPTYKAEVTVTSENTTTYWTRTLPANKKYFFMIYPRNCAGNGPKVNVLSNCSTSAQPPSAIDQTKFSSSNKVDSNGQIEINVNAVNEENGLVNCLLIVVTTKALQSNNTLLTQDQFTEFTDTIGYIAYCIEDVSSTTKTTLGRNEETICNIEKSVRAKRAIKNSTLKGNNIPLNGKISYSIYLVSVSIVNNELLYRRSEATLTVVSTPVAPTPNIVLIIGIVVGLLIALLIVIAVTCILIMRRRRKNKKALFNRMDVNPSLAPREDRVMMNSHEVDNVMNGSDNIESNGVIKLEIEANQEEQITYENFAFTKDPSLVTLKELEIELVGKIRNNLSNVKDEFNKLTSLTISQQPHAIASDSQNKTKNRFKNIYSYDHSQVSLNSRTNAYINASYIDGFKSPKKFIATQGPLESTVEDFWQMILEQNVSVIVMLTNCVEGTKNKCFKYWPGKCGLMKLSNISIMLDKETLYGGFVKRTFQVVHSKNTSRKITQFHMTTWPDHGIPMITSTVLTLYKHVVELASLNKKAPIVVHCSAGAGRTGTFIGLDICHNQMQDEGRVSFEHCITTMRQNRVQMIQTPEQYIFLQKLVVESCSRLICKVKNEDFSKETSTDSYKLSLRKRFETAKRIIPMHSSTEKSRRQFSGSKIIPYDVNAVTFYVETQKCLYNASYIYDYYGKKNLMIAEHPNQDKYDLYWNMIEMKDVNIIVCLDGVDMEFLNYKRDFSIQPETENDFTTIVKMQKLAVHDNEDSAPSKVVLFRKMDQQWTEQGIFDMISSLHKITNQQKNIICVQSRSNLELPGIFCASLNAIEQSKIEQEIDVIQAVKDVNDMRPNAITSIESVHLCVKVINEYLKASCVYENIVLR